MTPNRIVALLTPVFALAAGACATWLAEHFPTLDVPASALEEIFIAGALAVLAPALQWLYGWQKFEAREAEAQLAAEKAEAGVPDVAVQVTTDDDDVDEEELDDLDLGADDGTSRPSWPRSRPKSRHAEGSRRWRTASSSSGFRPAGSRSLRRRSPRPATPGSTRLRCARCSRGIGRRRQRVRPRRDRNGATSSRPATAPCRSPKSSTASTSAAGGAGEGGMPGVGPTQLTWWESRTSRSRGRLLEARREHARGLPAALGPDAQHGEADGARRYNGSAPPRGYSADLRAKARAWEARLEGVPMPAAAAAPAPR